MEVLTKTKTRVAIYIKACVLVRSKTAKIMLYEDQFQKPSNEDLKSGNGFVKSDHNMTQTP